MDIEILIRIGNRQVASDGVCTWSKLISQRELITTTRKTRKFTDEIEAKVRERFNRGLLRLIAQQGIQSKEAKSNV